MANRQAMRIEIIEQAEQIERLVKDRDLHCKESLEQRKENQRLKEFVKQVDDSIVEQDYGNVWLCDALRELKAAQPQGGSDDRTK